MQLLRVSTFLRLVLVADAATCLIAGLLMSLGGDFLQGFSNLPAVILFYAGLSLFPFAAFLVYLAFQEKISSAALWAVIALNALWVIDSFLIMFTSWIDPNLFGYAFIIIQALGVAVFAELEYIALRRAAKADVSVEQIA